MLDWLSQITDAVITFIQYLFSPLTGIVNLFLIFQKWSVLIENSYAILPAMVVPFIVVGIALSVVFLILKVFL